MSEFFFINQQIVLPKAKAVINKVESDLTLDPVDALRGMKMSINVSPIDISLEETSGDFFPDMFSVPYTLMSDKLKSGLDSLGITNIDFYPVRLLDTKNQKVIEGYWFANVLGRIKCVDVENSDTKTNALGNIKFKSFCIDENKTKGEELFRLDENGRMIIISERIFEALGKLNLEGVILRNTRDYDGYGI